jgi:hypothetical protein
MASAIDPTKPTDGAPSVKLDLRNNLQAAKNEIETLQAGKADLGHQHLVGDLTDAGALASKDVIEAGDIAAGAIASADLADAAVTTDQIADGAVTPAKLADGTANRLLGFDSGGNPIEIVAGTNLTIADGTISAGELGSGSVVVIAGTSFVLNSSHWASKSVFLLVDNGNQDCAITLQDSATHSPAGAVFSIASGTTGTVTVSRAVNGAINGGTSVSMKGLEKTGQIIVTSNPGNAPTARAEGEWDGPRSLGGPLLASGYQISGNLTGTGTASGTLAPADAGKVLRTTGNITIPQTAGFNVKLIAGGAHSVSFGAQTSPAMAAGDLMSIVVDDQHAIHAVLTTAAGAQSSAPILTEAGDQLMTEAAVTIMTEGS